MRKESRVRRLPSRIPALWRSPATLCLLTGPVVACAHYQHYHSAPLDVTASVSDYRSRRLADSGLANFLTDAGFGPTDSGWEPTQLALAALYFRGELPLARAAVAEARAAEMTARVRPSASVDASITRTARPLETAATPWSESITGGFTLELGGKRAARMARARAATLATQLRTEATAWQLAQDARAAGLGAFTADQDVADAAAETDALRALAGLFRARYSEGQVSLAEVARAEAEAQTAVVSVVDADRARVDARLALARALGVPFDGVDTLLLRVRPGSSCGFIDSVARPPNAQARGAGAGGRERFVRDSLATAALHGRPDVGATLADYAVAEGDVRLQVARQYPDLALGPGLLWDQGIPGWVLNVGLPSLLLSRNRGPIAEADARRAQQAARVRLLADSVLAAVDSGVAACRGVERGVATADSLVTAIQRQVDVARAAYQRGETGQTEVALAQLALVRARHTLRLATTRRAAAGAALDRAAGRWVRLLERGPWPDPSAAARSPAGAAP